MTRLSLLLLLIAPLALADEIVINLPPGTHYLKVVVSPDGKSATHAALPISNGGPAPNPPTVPPVTPPPTTGLAAQVQALTATALKEGATFTTAATISAVYSVVATQVEAGNVTLAQVGPALKMLTDATVPAAEVAAWTKWRTAVGALLATRTATKADAVAALREVEAGLKAAAGATAATSGKAIDWQELFKLLLPILLRLLEKFLAGGM